MFSHMCVCDECVCVCLLLLFSLLRLHACPVHITHDCTINSMSQATHKSGGAWNWNSLAGSRCLLDTVSSDSCHFLCFSIMCVCAVFGPIYVAWECFETKRQYWVLPTYWPIWISNKLLKWFLIFKLTSLYRLFGVLATEISLLIVRHTHSCIHFIRIH